jgi:hypothetical protein
MPSTFKVNLVRRPHQILVIEVAGPGGRRLCCARGQIGGFKQKAWHSSQCGATSSCSGSPFRQRHSLTRRSPDPGDAVSPSSPENAGVDHAPNPYSIRIDGYLGPTALSAFPDMVSQLKGGDTLLTGLLDRSALYGVLAEIEALGLDLVELRRLSPK